MRKILVFGLLSCGVASMLCAAQRGAMAPSMAAPAMRSMPAAPAAGGHAVPMHSPTVVHPGTHPVNPGMTPVLSQRPTNHNGHNTGFHNGQGRNGNPRQTGRTVRDNFCSTQPLNNFGANPAPGLGFDYPHFFAVHPTWNVCSQFSGSVVPWYGGYGGGYYPYPYTAQETEQENTSNEQPDSNHVVYVPVPAPPAAPSSPSSTYAPTEPVSEFVFVKHDGSTFSAVAYSWTKDKLQYVTKEGMRRSTGIDTLDLAATERMNEERGNTVNLPKALASSVALSIEPAPLR
jgi:hypothetical protein